MERIERERERERGREEIDRGGEGGSQLNPLSSTMRENRFHTRKSIRAGNATEHGILPCFQKSLINCHL